MPTTRVSEFGYDYAMNYDQPAALVRSPNDLDMKIIFVMHFPTFPIFSSFVYSCVWIDIDLLHQQCDYSVQ